MIADSGSASTSGEIDTIQLTNLRPEDVRLYRDSDGSLYIKVKATGEDLYVQWGMRNDREYTRIERLEFSDGTVWDSARIRHEAVQGTEAAETIWGNEEADTILGAGGNDTVEAGSGDDSVDGGAGNDILGGGAGRDTLAGGQGSDLLKGEGGEDTYIWGSGQGSDTIADSGSSVTNGQIDTIVLTNLAPQDVALARDVSGHLLLKVVATGESLLVNRGFQPGWEYTRVDKIQFADGTVWDYARIRQEAVKGTDASETLYGMEEADIVQAFAGDDGIESLGGNDSIDGGSGNDSINAGAGNDTIIGGSGNDFMQGGTGLDTYVWGSGQGSDTIRDTNVFDGSGQTDTIVLTNLGAADVLVATDPSSALILKVKVTGETLYVIRGLHNDWSYTWVEKLQLADGTVLGMTEMRAALANGGNLVPPNQAPVVNQTIAAQSTDEDANWVFTVPSGVFQDPNASDALNYTASLSGGAALPAWLQFDAATRTFQGTPGNADVGQLTVRVTATDPAGLSANTSFTLTVRNVNDTPVVSSPLAAQATDEDMAWSYTVPAGTFSDVDAGDVLTSSASLADGSALPGWLEFDPATGTFTATPDNAAVGTHELRVTATDTAGASTSTLLSLTVRNVNDAPEVHGAVIAQAIDEDVAWTLTLPADLIKDQDAGDVLTHTATLADGSPLPEWLSFDPVSQTFSGVPANANVGELNIRVMASDQAGLSAQTSFVVIVNNVNDAPEVRDGVAGQVATEDAPWTSTIPASAFDDQDVGDSLTLAATLANGAALPDWLQFDAASRIFSGTPTNDDVGQTAIRLTATDTSGVSVATTFTLTVANVNDAPVVGAAAGALTVVEGAALSHLFPASLFTDVDAHDDLTWSVTGADGAALPAWLHFDSASLTLSGLAPTFGTGVLGLAVTVTDTAGALASQDLIVTVTENPAITLNGGAGNDTLNGTSGMDRLRGGAGDDLLVGGAGSDLLSGGVGKDRLEGGTGSDIYLFGRGDGVETIAEKGSLSGDSDVLRFGEGIAANQLWFRKQGQHLEISVIDGQDSVTVQGWYITTDRQVEGLELANGQRLTVEGVETLLQAMAQASSGPGKSGFVGVYDAALESLAGSLWL
jgi:Ca2+-binding RTX toxin-like protein